MATIKDVARMAGVSISTVSKYINGGNVREENLDAIRHAIEVLDYRVNPFARSLKTQRSKSIGVLLPDITAPFFGNVLTALDKVLRENGYHSLISCYSSNHGLERDNLSFLLSAGIDGLIYAAEDLSLDEFYELTATRKIPVVQLDRTLQGLDADAVLVNNAEASYAAVSHLIEKGHRRVAMISGPKSVFSAKERQIGYLRALSDRGILYDDQLVISQQNDFATGYLGFESLMQLADKPTAVFTTNHNITMGFLTAAREQGLRIPIPVIHQPETEIGALAANYLIQRLDGYTGEPRMTKLKCKLNL